MTAAIGTPNAILGAFNNAVQCFQYVRLAKSFEEDLAAAVFKLDILQLRLTRFGVSIKLNEVSSNSEALLGATTDSDDYKTAEGLLKKIEEVFKRAQEQAVKFSKDKPAEETLSPYDLPQQDRNVHNSMRKLFSKRFKLGDSFMATKWALYGKAELEKLIEDVGDLIDDLIKLFPDAHKAQEELCKEEIEAMKEYISQLQGFIEELDPQLKAAMKGVQAQTSYSSLAYFYGSNNNGVQQGAAYGNQTFHLGRKS